MSVFKLFKLVPRQSGSAKCIRLPSRDRQDQGGIDFDGMDPPEFDEEPAGDPFPPDCHDDMTGDVPFEEPIDCTDEVYEDELAAG